MGFINDGDELRAQSWDEYVGQNEMKARLDIHIQSAVASGRKLPNILLDGSPGFGKTTLAQIIARRSGDDFYMLNMPIKPRVFEMVLRSWQGGLLFLDEIHLAPKGLQQDLYTFMEDGYLALPSGRRLTHDCIAVIGATTQPQDIQKPLFERFDLKPVFVDYSDDELGQIIEGMSNRIKLDLPKGLAKGLGRAAGGTPRHAKQFVVAARALAETQRKVTVESVLQLCAIDKDGLTAEHMAYLRALDELGGVCGRDKLINMTRLHSGTIDDLERLLVRRGFIAYSSAGRELTQEGSNKLHGTKQRIRREVA